MVTIPEAVRTLDRDLRRLFGDRLKSLVVYGAIGGGSDHPVATLAVVGGISADDLRACASRIETWHDLGLATPFLVAEREFERSLDAFPFEFGSIITDYQLVSGVNPFEGLRVQEADIRRACEVESRSHLLHLREGYLEAHNRSDQVADLIVRSAGPLAALVRNVSRLHHSAAETADATESAIQAARRVEELSGLRPGSLSEVVALVDNDTLTAERAREVFPSYLEAIGQLTNYIDRWHVNAL